MRKDFTSGESNSNGICSVVVAVGAVGKRAIELLF
jgi:hypothetical protein